MTDRRLWPSGALLAVACALAAPPAQATTLGRPLSLADLVRRSSDIVVGTVTKVSPRRLGSLATAEVELAVTDTIRGSARGTLTFRQLAGRASRQPENGRLALGLIPGLPTYTKGEAVLLFLGREGSLGLRTTVGLQQGRFSLRAGSAENGFANQGLFRGVAARAKDEREQAILATASGAVSAEGLIGLLHRAVEEQWWDGGVQ